MPLFALALVEFSAPDLDRKCADCHHHKTTQQKSHDDGNPETDVDLFVL
jgi:hypothetical protein